MLFAGVDRAAEEHAVTVLDAASDRFPADVPIAIDRPDGQLVDRLLEAGHHRYSGRRSPRELLQRLRSAPPGVADPAQTNAGHDAVIAPVRVLSALNASVNDLDRSVAAYLHAIRILGRAWIRVIYRCWADGVPYNPELHGNARQLTQPKSAA